MNSLEKFHNFKNRKILIVGNLGVEYLVFLNENIKNIEIGKSIKAKSTTKLIGGSAGFASSIASALGFSRITVLSVVGDDIDGKLILKELEKRNIEIDYIQHTDKTNVFLSIYSSCGKKLKKSLIFYIHQEQKWKKDYNKLVKNSDILFIYHTNPLIVKNILKILRMEKEKLIIFCPGDTFYSFKELFYNSLKRMDFLFLNRNEALNYTSKTNIKEAHRLLTKFCSKTVITMGECGCLIPLGSKPIPACKGDILHLSGAGDSFAVGFIYAYLLTNDFIFSGMFANALAYSIITRPNPIENPPSLNEIKNIMRNNYKIQFPHFQSFL